MVEEGDSASQSHEPRSSGTRGTRSITGEASSARAYGRERCATCTFSAGDRGSPPAVDLEFTPAFYLVVAGLIALVPILLIPETAGVSIRDVSTPRRSGRLATASD
jgi:hypothetical protein